jgi:predicted transposase YbfD/YdcC
MESRFFITSLVLSAVCLLRLIRGHWQVENCLHWMKDRGWEEDKHSLKQRAKHVRRTDECSIIVTQLNEGDRGIGAGTH